MGTIIRDATKEEIKGIVESDFFLKISVELGPRFTKGRTLNNEQLIESLKEHGDHWKSFIGPMLLHFAEHLERAKSDPAAPAMTVLNSTYYGCGSCGNNGSLCLDPNQNISCDEC